MTVTEKKISTAPKRQTQSSDAAKERMIENYLPLVRLVAEKIHRRLPPGVDLESLIHSGVVGLLEALDRFDPKRGVEFEVYARYRIRGEVMQCLRSLDWVSRSVRSWGRKIEAARLKLAGNLVREPNADEMAKELEIPLETYFHLDQQVSDSTLVSLEDLLIGSEAESEGAQEKFTHNPFLDPLSFVESKDLVVKVTAAVENLPKRERMILTLYYHEELTLREIGGILNLSEGRICQIFGQVVARLRNTLGFNSDSNDPAAAKRLAKPRKEKDGLMLYQGAIDSLGRAQASMAAGTMAEKGMHLLRANDIINQFIASLDHEVGGEIAQNLDGLYRYMLDQILSANLNNDPQPLTHVISLLSTLKSAWEEAVVAQRKKVASGRD